MRKLTTTKTYHLFLLLALLVALLAVVGGALASLQGDNGGAIAIQAFYKLDPRLSSPHLGERWVSPARYDVVSTGSRYTIETKVETVDANGARAVVAGNWVSSDPDLVMVMPLNRDPNIVALQVRGQGTATVAVSAGGHYKELLITAAYQTSTCANLRVVVSQTSQPEMTAATCNIMLPIVVNH